ncbi:hypothetical protein PsorP6_010867 [Peronosclerospora sorghi]|uniref:Uncharacterized protein n=1 Tax=Peronosclerospora sorghi TaxID=230839 RepID=A0ACC0VUB3_9STRA|nr:hypothetical protein PsorP6_010867 [Peronosclerospora sorghi]
MVFSWLLVVLHLEKSAPSAVDFASYLGVKKSLVPSQRLLSKLNNNYVQHRIHQRPEQWKEYQSLRSDEEEDQFFQSVPVLFVNKLESHFESERGLRSLVNKSIVEVIIGDLLFHFR